MPVGLFQKPYILAFKQSAFKHQKSRCLNAEKLAFKHQKCYMKWTPGCGGYGCRFLPT